MIKISSKKILTILTIAAIFVFNANHILAARANSGWIHAQSSENTAVCGINVNFSVNPVEYNNSILLAADNDLTFEILRNSDGSIIWSQSATNTQEIGPACFNFCQNSARINILAGSVYPEFGGVYAFTSDCGVAAKRSKRLRDFAHLKPTSQGIDYEAISPVDIWTNVPEYKINLANYPVSFSEKGVTYNSPGISTIAIIDYLNGVTPTTTYKSYTGGKGIYTFPQDAAKISDGEHLWSFYIVLSDGAGGTLASGRSFSKWFGLDRANPTINSDIVAPVNPLVTDNVVISTEAIDPLSGLTNIKIYLDGVEKKSCDFTSPTTGQLCSVDLGLLPSGIYKYYIVATDRAGNVMSTESLNRTFLVSAPNSPPTALPDSYSVDENGVLTKTAANGVLANDNDPDGDPLTAILVNNVSHGNLVFNSDGSFVYTPDAGYSGADSFTYKANDGAADSAVMAVSLTVDNVNISVTLKAPVLSEGCLTNYAAVILSWDYMNSQGRPQASYEIEITNQTTGLSFVKTGGASQSWAASLGDLEYGTSYVWRVRVTDSGGVISDWADGDAATNNFSTYLHRHPTPSYSQILKNLVVGEEAKFIDTSISYGGSSIQSWEWTFANGTPAASNIQNPTVVYQQTGETTITLKVTDSDGYSCTITDNHKIISLPKWLEW